jgi:predicted AAA+ superfamily ATPase
MPKWELIVNRLHRQGIRLVLTGSNSNLLNKELATHLTGRHLLTHIFPFSLGEIFSFGDKELSEASKKQRCSDYVSHGGFPEPWVKSLNFKDYLQVLFDSVLFKDIIRRYRLRQPEALGRLAAVLLAGMASPVSMQSLTRSTGIGSLPTLEKYFGYLAESFLFFPVSRFSWKVREQVRSNRKIYCYDNGYYEAKAFRFSPDWGRLYENAVAIELKRRTLNGDQQMFYWMNVEGEEVDFVIQEGLVIMDLIQVCYRIDASATKSREVRALLKASADLKCGKLTIVTGDYEGTESFTWFGFSGDISFVPLWKWLVQ